MKKFYLLILGILSFASNISFGQTQAIPAAQGGFEAGLTFPLNSWTVVNDATNTWVVGTAAPPYAGSNSAYISSSLGVSNDYLDASAQVSHFYRDILLPAGAKNITLSFYFKGDGEFPAGDRLTVYTAPTSVNPAAGSLPGVGATQVYAQTAAQGTYGQQTIPLPDGLGGTAVRLIFTWENNGNLISTDPPASVDDVSFTYCVDPTTADAGPDQTGAATCGLTSVTLAANTPIVGTGAWSVVTGVGGSFSDASSPGSTFTGTAGTAYTLRWTITNAPCTASTDDVNITFNQNPTTAAAGPDQTGASTCGLTTVPLAANTPAVGTGAWSIVSGTGGSTLR